MAECSLPESQELSLEMTVLAKIAESRDRRMFGNKNNFSCQSNLPFCVDKIHPKPNRGLPQASHGIMLMTDNNLIQLSQKKKKSKRMLHS